MVVAREYCVNSLDRGKRHRCVAHEFGMLCSANAGMRQRNDDVGTLLFHHRHISLGGIHDVAGMYVAFQMATVPSHDLRRNKADQANPDLVHVPDAVDDLFVHHDVWRNQGDVPGRVRAQLLGDIGRNHRKIGADERLHQEIEPIVELVISERRCVKLQRVQRGDDRVHVPVLHAPLIGHVIAHRVPLQEVAVVVEDRVRGFAPDLAHDRGHARQTHRVAFTVGIVVVGPYVHMKIGGLHDAQVGLIGSGTCGERVQRREAGCCCKKPATTEIIRHFAPHACLIGVVPIRCPNPKVRSSQARISMAAVSSRIGNSTRTCASAAPK